MNVLWLVTVLYLRMSFSHRPCAYEDWSKVKKVSFLFLSATLKRKKDFQRQAVGRMFGLFESETSMEL